ncbi:MAG: HAMP domain-containing sensor histidine kinase [Chthoniobacterales bacterium]
MSERGLLATAVLETLGFAAFSRTENGALRSLGETPAWLSELWPALQKEEAEIPVAEASPFFENFLIDAEECWKEGGEQRARSGPWVEETADGKRVELEATAMTANGHAILLIERMGAEFAAKKNVLQKARETVIAHQRLNSEIQKKEILLHCVADEMTATLANIVTSLRLIEAEDNPPRTKVLLGLATRGTEEQQRLIGRVLDVFSEEMGTIYGGKRVNGNAADFWTALSQALEIVEEAFAGKGVKLSQPAADDGAWRVPVETSHLERVLTGLLENALERSSAGGEVAITAKDEADSLLCRVTDSAPRMSAEAYDDLFSKFGMPAAGSQASAVRLHFCRIVIESCGGEIGCEPGETSGNIFWIRLPKVVAK